MQGAETGQSDNGVVVSPNWMIRRLEVLQAQYRADANNHRLGSFRQSEALAFALSLEYALNGVGGANFSLIEQEMAVADAKRLAHERERGQAAKPAPIVEPLRPKCGHSADPPAPQSISRQEGLSVLDGVERINESYYLRGLISYPAYATIRGFVLAMREQIGNGTQRTPEIGSVPSEAQK